jgi:hypothetical protein
MPCTLPHPRRPTPSPLVTPAAAHLADAYAHLGAPKRFVHLVGPPDHQGRSATATRTLARARRPSSAGSGTTGTRARWVSRHFVLQLLCISFVFFFRRVTYHFFRFSPPFRVYFPVVIIFLCAPFILFFAITAFPFALSALLVFSFFSYRVLLPLFILLSPLFVVSFFHYSMTASVSLGCRGPPPDPALALILFACALVLSCFFFLPLFATSFFLDYCGLLTSHPAFEMRSGGVLVSHRTDFVLCASSFSHTPPSSLRVLLSSDLTFATILFGTRRARSHTPECACRGPAFFFFLSLRCILVRSAIYRASDVGGGYRRPTGIRGRRAC